MIVTQVRVHILLRTLNRPESIHEIPNPMCTDFRIRRLDYVRCSKNCAIQVVSRSINHDDYLIPNPKFSSTPKIKKQKGKTSFDSFRFAIYENIELI